MFELVPITGRLVPACLALLLAAPAGAQSAPVTSAPRAAIAQPLAILFQVVANISDAVVSRQLELVHNEDMMLYSSLTLLQQQSRLAPTDRREAMGAAITKMGRAVADLHTAADAGEQAKAETQLTLVNAAVHRLKEFHEAENLERATQLAGRYTCAAHPEMIGAKSALCARCGTPMDQIVRVPLTGAADALCGAPAPRTMRAEIRVEGPLRTGTPAKAVLRLAKLNGTPVLLSDLRESHTQKIHLMLIDSGLTDYHHAHPQSTATPGEYTFEFSPNNPGAYRAWADVRSTLTGFHEYLIADIASVTAGVSLKDKSIQLVAERDGLRGEIIFKQAELRAGQPVAARLRITKNDGAPVEDLEPFMAAFAHFAGFHEDRQTVLHLHPKGLAVTNAAARGGPELEFTFFSHKAGFVRLFAQVQRGGVATVLPFGVNVAPETAAIEPVGTGERK